MFLYTSLIYHSSYCYVAPAMLESPLAIYMHDMTQSHVVQCAPCIFCWNTISIFLFALLPDWVVALECTTTFLLGWSQILKGKGGWSLKISHAWAYFIINYWFNYWWQFISQFMMNCLLLALFTTLMINGLQCQTNIPITGGEWMKY